MEPHLPTLADDLFGVARARYLTLEELLPLCERVRDGGGRLVALWASDWRDVAEQALVLSVALQDTSGLSVVEVALDGKDPSYPDLSGVFFNAGRLQRAAFDLVGVHAVGASDQRPWLRHGAWPEQVFPLRHEPGLERSDAPDPYRFVRVEGDGVHEIPVGPVHAGIIEPGHFRFSVVGEKVLRLEERLGYAHKGIEKRFTQLAPLQAHRLAGRGSGDSTLAHFWAYCIAPGSAARAVVFERRPRGRGRLLWRGPGA